MNYAKNETPKVRAVQTKVRAGGSLNETPSHLDEKRLRFVKLRNAAEVEGMALCGCDTTNRERPPTREMKAGGFVHVLEGGWRRHWRPSCAGGPQNLFSAVHHLNEQCV